MCQVILLVVDPNARGKMSTPLPPRYSSCLWCDGVTEDVRVGDGMRNLRNLSFGSGPSGALSRHWRLRSSFSGTSDMYYQVWTLGSGSILLVNFGPRILL